MKYVWLALIALLGLLPSSELQAKTFLFDMGTEGSELRGGFVRITTKSDYSRQAGFGWKSTKGLKSHHRHYEREWVYSESRGRKQPPAMYTNEVTCDTIYSDVANTFLIDVAPGNYTVYVLCGRSAGSAREYHHFDIVAGQSSATIKIPGPYIFEKRELSASVENGQLSVAFRPTTDWMVAGLIVFPTSERERVCAETITALEKETFFLPPDEAQKWTETKHVDSRPLPEFSASDRQRGYAVFAKHWSEVVYPNTVPRAADLDVRLQTFASLGEYEPITLTVLPLRELGECRVSAGALKSADGVIPSENIEVRSVRYMLVRPNYSTFFSYHIAPDVLESKESVQIRAGCNQRFWITIHVPDDASAGVYRGMLTFEPESGRPAQVPFDLRVLPIRLRKNPEHIYGMYYRDPLQNVTERNRPQANAYFRRKAELERRDMVQHGMNSHISGVSGLSRNENGNWTMDGAETERRIALDRKYGLADKPLVVSFPVGYWYGRLVDKRGLGSHMRLVRADVPQSFFDEVTKMVQAVETEKKKYDWPEFLYYPIDEPSTREESVLFMANVLKAIKRVPGVRTYVTADPSHEQFEPMWPHVDVWCCQPFVFGHEKIKQLSERHKIEFWCYPNHISGENDHTPVRGARMTWGYGFWKSGFRTLIPWIYQSSLGDPWNYLDSTAMDFFNRSTPDGEPIPVTMWEAYREGIDDGRYLYTLQKLVEENRGAGGDAARLAQEAEAELRQFWDDINVQEKYKFDDLWSGADFDTRRWLLASLILKLQGVDRP